MSQQEIPKSDAMDDLARGFSDFKLTESGQSSDTRGYLQKLLSKAERFCKSSGSDAVEYLYRCKPREYFAKLDGIMRKVLKDEGGDPQCPINGKLKGVFFGVTLFRGCLPNKSPFGDKRVTVPLKDIFTNRTNLYFADFYCLRGCPKNHSVCLVVTKKDSEEDYFCKENLVELDVENNDFLWKVNSTTYWTARKYGLYIDVFYTEDVNIEGRDLMTVEPLGQGHSSPGGIPKSRSCKICNVESE